MTVHSSIGAGAWQRALREVAGCNIRRASGRPSLSGGVGEWRDTTLYRAGGTTWRIEDKIEASGAHHICLEVRRTDNSRQASDSLEGQLVTKSCDRLSLRVTRLQPSGLTRCQLWSPITANTDEWSALYPLLFPFLRPWLSLIMSNPHSW